MKTAYNNVFMSAWGSVGIVVSGSLFNFIHGGQFGAGRTWHSYRHCQALLIPSRHKHGPLAAIL